MKEIVDLILKHGYNEDGHTSTDTFKIITTNSFPLAGRVVTLGGRYRFKKGTNHFVTIGKRVTCFYTKSEKGEASSFVNFKTKDIIGIQKFLQEVTQQ